jgi:hypothetical protein
LQDLPLVRDQLGLERLAALEGALPEYPLAESVDGEDRRLVEACTLGKPAAGAACSGCGASPAGPRLWDAPRSAFKRRCAASSRARIGRAAAVAATVKVTTKI